MTLLHSLCFACLFAWFNENIYCPNLLLHEYYIQYKILIGYVLTLYNRSICLLSYSMSNIIKWFAGGGSECFTCLMLTCFWGSSVCLLSTTVRVITASTECLISAAIIFSSINALLVGFGANRLNRGHGRQKPFVN